MKIILNVFKFIRDFTKRLSADDVGALSAQAAFFLILSFFPFVMLLIPLIKYLPFASGFTFDFSHTVMPAEIRNLLNIFIDEIYAKPSMKFISLTAAAVLWIASGGITALMNGFNKINRIEETRNYAALRFMAIIYTVLFVLIIVAMVTVFLFGNLIYQYISNLIPALENTAYIVICGRTLAGILILSLLFWLFYCFLPNRRCRLISAVPGSFISALSWVGFSYVYSFYIDRISNYPYIYGSLSAVVFLMFWLYICMYIIFIGEEINILLRERKNREMSKIKNQQYNRKQKQNGRI
ncbi:MAG: YihY/virulence factor BrkB family protein [Oscillospiraceae bacterium]|nr:YihY/virulence factor BrkB family protein [Oscillospiraceae bacterium]